MHHTTHMISMALACACALALTASDAHAFCGTYVSTTDGPLVNDATTVALMRDGTTTVLSMQNAYRGPAEGFAMVVPVPVILMEDQVKTLERDVFDRLDTFTAPRLVEYVERDPCEETSVEVQSYCGSRYSGGCGLGMDESTNDALIGSGEYSPTPLPAPPLQVVPDPLVEVEAEFTVGEYEIVILSSEQASDLTTWLAQNGYAIPQGSDEVLSSYIEQGMYFFVAKVDPSKVDFDAEGNAVLRPLRFHYDSDALTLPIRLGLLNADGPQDLVVFTLSVGSRYDVSNYPTTTIPTNLPVVAETREQFAGFYDGLFEQALEEQPSAIVTEYAWGGGPEGLSPEQMTSAKCDPCPPSFSPSEPTLIPQGDVASLGGDVLDPELFGTDGSGVPSLEWHRLVLTRMHARLAPEDVSEDLVFETAGLLTGGTGTGGLYQQQTIEYDTARVWPQQHQFQGRYIVHHRWPGDIVCDRPVHSRWVQGEGYTEAKSPNNAQVVAPMPVQDHMDLLDTELGPTELPEVVYLPCTETDDSGCSSASGGTMDTPLLVLMALAMVGIGRRRRTR